MVLLLFLEEWNTFFIGALDTGEFCEWRATPEAGKAVANSVQLKSVKLGNSL